MLKILEEPPEYVIFLFCTTDPQKIIGTIMSRVQRFNFKRISVQGIYNRLLHIIYRENYDYFNDTTVSPAEFQQRQALEAQGVAYIDYEEPAVQYIARLSKGGMRDAITTLEKCLDYSKTLTLNNVLTVTSGGVTEQIMLQLLQLLLTKKAKDSLFLFNEIYMSGVDISLFIKLFIEFLENCSKFILTQDKNIVTISDITINWLYSNMNTLEEIRSYLFTLLNIKTSYSSEDLKIVMESWIIQKCC